MADIIVVKILEDSFVETSNDYGLMNMLRRAKSLRGTLGIKKIDIGKYVIFYITPIFLTSDHRQDDTPCLLMV